jgi:hypothetical protein
MSDKQEEQENVYKKYSIRSEHTLCRTAEKNSKNYSKSCLWIEGKLWFILIIPIFLVYFFYMRIIFCREFNESSKYGSDILQLQILVRKSPASNVKTTAEILLWCWDENKEIAVLDVR